MESERASESIGRNFSSAFNGAANRAQQQKQFDAMLPIKQQEAANETLKTWSTLQGQAITNTLNENNLKMFTQDQQTFGQWMNDHPTLESRANAEPPTLLTPQGNQMFSAARANDSASLLGQQMKSDQADFAKRLSAIPAADRATIMAMPRDPQTGLPTADQWHALGESEQDVLNSKRNFDLNKAAVAPTIRAGATVDAAQIKADASLEALQTKLQSAKNQASSILDKAKLASYNGELHSIWGDFTLSADQKKQQFNDLNKRYGLEGKLKFDEPSSQQSNQSGKVITDKQGKKWAYSGSMADPTQDKDPNNWKIVE